MKELVVISGKGGTGKTSIVASFAALARGAVLADCDVDAADLHLVLAPEIERTEAFKGGKKARIRPELCKGCGMCLKLCRFGAVVSRKSRSDAEPQTYCIDPISCEGCGVCAEFCPSDAIELEEVVNGEWYLSRTRFGPMLHAKLGIAEENSGKLVTTVRGQARKVAEQEGIGLIIADGPPGIGCPVIASIGGSDLVLIVTEPTLSGLHDLERVRALARHFEVPAVVCINKYDLNPEVTTEIATRAAALDAPVVGKIRYDPAVTKAQIASASVIEYTTGPVSHDIRALWQKVAAALGQPDGAST